MTRLVRAGFLPLSALLLVTAAMVVPLPLIIESPGSATSLAACVQLEHEEAGHIDGDFLLMTIGVEGATLLDAVQASTDPHADVVRRGQVIAPGIDNDAYFRQQQVDFALMADRAAAVGLADAGFATDVTGDGVQVVATQPGAPADGVLQRADVITQINDTAIADEGDLRSAVDGLTPGREAVVGFTRAGAPMTARIVPAEFEGRLVLGVIPRTANPQVTLPFSVDVAAGSIGGTSAGLMIALTVYDKALPGVDVAQGRSIAGTGEVDDAGRVGRISGAGLKVVAADRAGADIFLVPTDNHAEAVALLPPSSDMKVIAVSTFAQAKRALGERPAEGTPEAPQPCPYDTAA